MDLLHALRQGVRGILRGVAARFLEGCEGHHQGVVELLQAFQVPYDDFAQGGGLIAEHEPFVQLFFVFHEEKGRFGVVHDKLNLLPGIGGINPDGYAAGALHGHVSQHPFGAVVTDDANAIARLQSHVDQSRSNLSNLFEVGLPGYVAPQAECFLAQGDPVWLARHRLLENLGGRIGRRHITSTAVCVSTVGSPWPTFQPACRDKIL